MTGTLIVAGEFEVEADAFGMSNMQIAIGLGGKTCAYACTVYPTLLLYGCRPRFARPALFSVRASRKIIVNNAANKVWNRSGTGSSGHTYVKKVSGEVRYFAMFPASCSKRFSTNVEVALN